MQWLRALSAIAPVLILCGVLQAASETSRAVFQETRHDFGTVNRGTKIVHDFRLRNQGTVPLTIGSAELTMSGMKVNFKRTIGPNEEARVTLEWDTSAVNGEVSGQAILRLDDPAQPEVVLMLTGVVKLPIEFRPFPAVFFSLWKGEGGERSVTVINNEERPLQVFGLEPAGTHFFAKIDTVEPGKAYTLRVTVPAETPPGRYREAVYLKTDHPTRSRIKIGVNVFVKADLYADPDALDFGIVNSSQLAKNPQLLGLLTQPLLVKRRQGKFEIKSVVSDLSMLSISRSSVSPDQIHRIDVGLVRDRLQPGKIAGTIQIETDDRNFPKLTVPVRGEVR